MSAHATKILGRYHLLRPLGRGGGGEVYEAVLHGPAGFRRRVAVKLLPEHLRTHQHQEAFLQEARLGGLVSHPNVVSTLELVEHQGRWMLVMDLVAGVSIAQLRRRGPLPANALIDLGRQVCQGLHHIHTLTDEGGQPLGLVHRDIKPANLLLSHHGVVQIADLGIARLVGQPDMPAGTPGYMPPEQLDGTERAPADLFALGATLAHLATGERPFGRGRAALMAVHRADAMVAKQELRSRIDAIVPGLGEVVARSLRADPAERWPTARAMGEALRGLYAKSPSSQHLSTLLDTAELRGEPDTATQQSTLVGRARELEALTTLLDDEGVAIVVVTGPGGVGKTRLADHALRGRDALRCDAARAVTLPGLCLVVAEALGSDMGNDPVANIGAALAQRGRLLVGLDNVEQAVDAAAEALAAWRVAAPHARFVATSRVALRRDDAVELRLGPLPTDDAVALLQERLGHAADREQVRRLVRQVERLPLAVELVAAQARASSVGQVLTRLEGRGSGAPEVLREQLDASWALLPAEGQRALVLLASFEGPFDHHDAVGVLDPATPALDRLALLVDHSLLHVRGNRFRLLPTVRAFARSCDRTLCALGEERHGRWMARLGTAALVQDGAASVEQQVQWRGAAEELLTAFRRAHAAGRGEVAVACALALGRAMVQSGPLEVIEGVLMQALAWGLRTSHLLRQLGWVQQSQSRLDEAEATFRRAVAAGDGVQRLRAEVGLATVWGLQGRPSAAPALARAWVAQRDRGDTNYASTLGELGQVLALSGHLEEGERALEQAITACEQVGDPDLGYHLGHLATVHAMAGRHEACERTLLRAIQQLEHESKGRLLAIYQANYAELLLLLGRPGEASQYIERSFQRATEVGLANTMCQARALASDVARQGGDYELAQTEAQAAHEIAVGIQDDNALADALVALALALHALGDTTSAVPHLEQAASCPRWVYGPTRALAQLHLARLTDPARAAAAMEPWPLDGADEPPLQRAYARLATGWLALHRHQQGAAKAAVLDAQLALARIDLPPQSPAHSECERLRQAIAG